MHRAPRPSAVPPRKAPLRLLVSALDGIVRRSSHFAFSAYRSSHKLQTCKKRILFVCVTNHKAKNGVQNHINIRRADLAISSTTTPFFGRRHHSPGRAASLSDRSRTFRWVPHVATRALEPRRCGLGFARHGDDPRGGARRVGRRGVLARARHPGSRKSPRLPRGSELAPRATSAATMPHAVRCAHEGCGVMFHYSMQSRVRLGSVFCSAHQPVALPGGKDQPRSAKSDSGSGKSSDGKLSPEPPEPNAMSPAVTNGAAASAAARIRGDGTARTTGLKAFLALRDSTGTWSSMACRVCGYVQNQNKNQTHGAKGGKGAAGAHALNANSVGAKSVGKVMNAVSSRSSLDCGCMRKWEVVVGGLSYRFCSGCKLYHELKCFENEKSAREAQQGVRCVQGAEAPAKAGRGARQPLRTPRVPLSASRPARRFQRVNLAAASAPPRASDSVSPEDSVTGDGGGSLGSNDAVNTGVTNSGGAKGSDAIGVGGEDAWTASWWTAGATGTARERVDKLRNCSMFNRGAPPAATASTTFSTRSSTTRSSTTSVKRRVSTPRPRTDSFATPSPPFPPRYRATCETSRTPGTGATFTEISSPRCSTANRTEATTRGRGSATSSRAPSSSAWTRSTSPRDAPRASTCFAPRTTCSSARAAAGPAGGDREGGGGARRMRRRVRRRSHLPRARGPEHRRPGALPRSPRRGALERGALRDGSYADAHLTDATPALGPLRHAGANSLVRVELNGDVLGAGDVALRCRFAGTTSRSRALGTTRIWTAPSRRFAWRRRRRGFRRARGVRLRRDVRARAASLRVCPAGSPFRSPSRRTPPPPPGVHAGAPSGARRCESRRRYCS